MRFRLARIRRAITIVAIGFVTLTVSAAAILSMALPVEPVRIHVRWRLDVTASQREQLERRFALVEGRPTEGTTWNYLLTDSSRKNIRNIVQHDAVDDTAHLNRIWFRPTFADDRPRQVWLFALAFGILGAALLSVRLAAVESPAWHSRLQAILAYDSTQAVAALSIAVSAFAFRFLTLRDFANDHYMHLAWAQQLLSGAVPNRDFVDPGYPLTYALSAVAQLISPGPLSESVLTIGMLSIAAGMTMLVTRAMTGSLTAGIAAATACVLFQPQLYNYPKLLVPAVALWLLARFQAQPSRGRLAICAAWTTVSFLFRHDLGLYVAAATIAALLLPNVRAPRPALRQVGAYVSIGLLTVLPYLLFVQWAEGIPANIRDSLQFLRAETSPLATPAPEFPFLGTWAVAKWNRLDSVATLFYLARLLVPLAIFVLVVRRHQQRGSGHAVITAAIVLLALYATIILRHPVAARIRDLAVPLPIVGTWLCWNLLRAPLDWPRYRPIGWAAAIGGAILAVAGFGSVCGVAEAGQKLRETRVLEGWRPMQRRAEVVVERTRTWNGFWPVGQSPPLIDYVDSCTAPSDHLLITWAAPEYYVFAHRPFAAGHALFGGFTSDRDQLLMLSRLQQQHVSIVLIDEGRRAEFARRYHLLDGYLRERYAVVGHYRLHDDSNIAIALRRDLQAMSSYGAEGWPCGFTIAG